jgi:cob(I)alamin adenosyltransferase
MVWREKQMSIATELGDRGETALVGGERVSTADLRVEAYGSVDELNSFLGFARSLCSDVEIAAWTETIQRTLFRVGGALSTPPTERGSPAAVLPKDVAFLTERVHRIEAMEGILADWSLPGAHRESAAFEICRTVCRRVERHAVRLGEAGQIVAPEVLAYLNRLSDLLWLFGRRIELQAGVDARLRKGDEDAPGWSRAW